MGWTDRSTRNGNDRTDRSGRVRPTAGVLLTVLAGLLLLLPAALGGRLTRLAEVDVRRRHWLLVGLLLQVAALGLGDQVPRGVLAGLHVSSYLLLGSVLWANRRLPGAGAIGLGGLLNGLTIALNGGTLPASAAAMSRAGLIPDGSGFSNSAPLEDPRLWFFGDVFAVPAPLPLANVFSVGDVLILAGVAVASVGICGTRWTTGKTAPSPRSVGR